jgi:hypothetical protein
MNGPRDTSSPAMFWEDLNGPEIKRNIFERMKKNK